MSSAARTTRTCGLKGETAGLRCFVGSDETESRFVRHPLLRTDYARPDRHLFESAHQHRAGSRSAYECLCAGVCMLTSLWRGLFVALVVSLGSLACTIDSPLGVDAPGTIAGTVESVEIDPARMRVHVLLHRERVHPLSPREGATRLPTQVVVGGRAELGGRDKTLMQVLAGVADGTIAPGKTVRFRTTGAQVHVGGGLVYATHLLR